MKLMSQRLLKIFAFAFLCSFSSIVLGQNWESSYQLSSMGRTHISDIKITSDNDLIVAGYSDSLTTFFGIPISSKGFVARLDTNYNVEWVVDAATSHTLLMGDLNGGGATIHLDENDDIFLLIRFSTDCQIVDTTLLGNSGEANTALAKISSTGSLIWAKYVTDNSVGTSLTTNSSGDIYITAFTQGISNFDGNIIDPFGSANVDGVLAKYDPTGNFVWVKQFGGTGSYSDAAHDVKIDGNGNIIVGGHFRSDADFDGNTLFYPNPFPSESVGFVAKWDSTGVLQWLEYAGRTVLAIEIMDDNSIIAGGSLGYSGGHFGLADSMITNTAELGLATISKLNENGVYQWIRYTYEARSDEIHDITIDDFGNIYGIGDYADTLAVGSDTLFGIGELTQRSLMLWCLNSNGDVLWLNGSEGPDNTRVEGTAVEFRNCILAICGAFAAPAPITLDQALTSLDNEDGLIAIHENCLSNGLSEMNPREASIKVYPNPAQNEFTIDVQNNELMFITVYDMQGRIRYKTEVVDKVFSIDVLSFETGIYIISALTQDGEQISKIIEIAH
jgi:hypothetical protein